MSTGATGPYGPGGKQGERLLVPYNGVSSVWDDALLAAVQMAWMEARLEPQ